MVVVFSFHCFTWALLSFQHCILDVFKFVDVYVRELEWNPEDPDLAIVCLSNGLVSLIKISKHSVNVVATLPTTSKFYSGKNV